LIEILARRGDSRLGGIDFDFAVAADIATHIQKQYPDFDSRIITADRVEFRQRYVNNRPNRRSFYDLRWRFFDTAERIKIELSEPERTETEYSFLSILDQNGQDIKLDGKTVTIRESYTRERFEDQVQTKIVRSLEVLDNALNAAGVRKEEVDIVLLTGQISRIPIIRQTIQEYFPGSPHIPPIEEFDPKTCVSMGATYLAEILESPEGAVRVEGLNCMSCRYGYKKVEGLAGARFVEVIPDKHPYGGEPQFTEFTIPEVGDLNVRILQNMGTNDEASNNPDILTVGDVYLRGPSGSTVRLEWIVHEFGILRIRTEDREEEIRSVGDSFDGIF
jgi:molecular chaperone DnaK (HSP70)